MSLIGYPSREQFSALAEAVGFYVECEEPKAVLLRPVLDLLQRGERVTTDPETWAAMIEAAEWYEDLGPSEKTARKLGSVLIMLRSLLRASQSA